ncbi:hypothetical protein [Streptomyces sp. BK239]|uniref:hypothetical protein n=1 Tax=Streptomyces sp. BK239 TaxID=2512155 RepID=UPI0010D072E5|nr:hypothetical protein [Streptomyces sp. BK239]RZU21780.1 hypothetical protein EV567_2287 [Streptomyces sp. BK239]
MDMRRIVAVLIEEAEQQIQDQVWKLEPSDRALALDTEAGLRDVVGPPNVQEDLPQIKRLEHLRETLAVLAISLARTHGRLAWFLSGALTPSNRSYAGAPCQPTVAAASALSSPALRNTRRRRMPSADSRTPLP